MLAKVAIAMTSFALGFGGVTEKTMGIDNSFTCWGWRQCKK